MKALFDQTKQNVLYLTTVVCIMLTASLSALAIPPAQVARTTAVQSEIASCVDNDCGAALIQPTVKLTEPAALTPVIVTWSADYNVTGTSVVLLSVNGGTCLAYGPFTLQEPQLIAGSNSITVSDTHQWVVLPSDGVLVKGTNTFQVCVAGYLGFQTINIGYSTLTVQSQ
ncbi:MAG: hypothetical protein ABSD75_34600 [Terriglobales bacterium]